MSSHDHIREDKTCLNCRHVVEMRFCPNCGQENTDSRKTFHHLFVHFFEDLTHYENSFWKTIRNLMLKPGRLTQAYLSGKRVSYLAPIRLYIFISFVTFFVISVLPEVPETPVEIKLKEKESRQEDQRERKSDSTAGAHQNVLTGKEGFRVFRDSVAKAMEKAEAEKKERTTEKDSLSDVFKAEASVRAYDSAQALLPPEKRSKGFHRWAERTASEIKEKREEDDFDTKFAEAFVHNIPKALFIYMPIFAFWLWLFHDKKRWYYFEHGIFTLHYFSFMLLTFCCVVVFYNISEWIDWGVLTTVAVLAWVFLFGWWFFYFFRSHSRFYGERKAISRLKGVLLFVINMWLISFLIIGLLLYTVLHLH